NTKISTVAELIDRTTYSWEVSKIKQLFGEAEAQQILSTPLSCRFPLVNKCGDIVLKATL
ncbi:hypothetical protein Ancab_018796, partial [Ancistrocladus abbreviatus]